MQQTRRLYACCRTPTDTAAATHAPASLGRALARRCCSAWRERQVLQPRRASHQRPMPPAHAVSARAQALAAQPCACAQPGAQGSCASSPRKLSTCSGRRAHAARAADAAVHTASNHAAAPQAPAREPQRRRAQHACPRVSARLVAPQQRDAAESWTRTARERARTCCTALMHPRARTAVHTQLAAGATSDSTQA